MPTNESFMQMLNKSRRSSSSTVEGEISALEESIISKSGIEITKHTELKKNEEQKTEHAKGQVEEKKEVLQSNEPPVILAAPNTIVDGTEQTLKTEKPLTEEQKVEQMLKESEEEAFDHLDRRSEKAEETKVEASEQKKEAKVEQQPAEEEKAEIAQATVEGQPTEETAEEQPTQVAAEE